jgi:predicted RNA-binding protein YlxR (DUF448 family)
MKGKKELIRVVRISESDESDKSEKFELDFGGKKSGRGAYVCPNLDCLEKAHKKKGLERSFGQAVPSKVYEQLRREMAYGES